MKPAMTGMEHFVKAEDLLAGNHRGPLNILAAVAHALLANASPLIRLVELAETESKETAQPPQPLAKPQPE